MHLSVHLLQIRRIPQRAISAILVIFFASITFQSQVCAASSESQIDALIAKMSLEEKVSLLGGTGFDTKPIPRLGIPAIEMTDGPLGVREGPMTAFPSGLSMGASFDPLLVGQVADAIAEETRFSK